ncbi:hypothetical protein ABBQ32_012924 [Trebouxia sp. C0010 RCD-2024]
MGWTLVTGIRQTCRSFTSEQNDITNERAAAILAIVLIVFSAWQIWNWLEMLRCLGGCWKRHSWGCGLAGDSVSLSILNAGLGAAVASTICFTQVQTVSSQAAALAAFSHANMWLFVETWGEAVGQAFSLVPLVLASLTLWSLADQWHWYGNHDPRWYLLNAAVVTSIAIVAWLLTCSSRVAALEQFQFQNLYYLYKADGSAIPAPNRMPGYVWVDGASAIKLQRARIVCAESKKLIPYKFQVVLIIVCTAGGALVTAVRSAITTKDAFDYNFSSDGQAEGISHTWYLMSAVASCVAHGCMLVTSLLTAAIIWLKQPI